MSLIKNFRLRLGTFLQIIYFTCRIYGQSALTAGTTTFSTTRIDLPMKQTLALTTLAPLSRNLTQRIPETLMCNLCRQLRYLDFDKHLVQPNFLSTGFGCQAYG